MPEYEKADPMNPDTFNEHNTFWTGSGIRSTFVHIPQDKWDKAFSKKKPLNIQLGFSRPMRFWLRYQWNLNMAMVDMGNKWRKLEQETFSNATRSHS